MHTKFDKPWFGFICALTATLIWSTNFVLARGINDLVPPVTLAFLRWTVAVLVFAPFALKPLRSEWALIRKYRGYLLFCGILSVSLYNTLIYIAAHTTCTLNLAVINESTPLFIIIFARLLLKEKFTLLKAVGVALTTFGVLLLISNGNFGNLLKLSFRIGDLWVLAAAIAFALYSTLIKKRPAEISLVTFIFTTFVLGWLVLIPFFCWEAARQQPVIYNLKLLGVVFYLGIFASIIAYIAWTRAVQLIGPTKSALIYYLLPVFSGIQAIIWLHEPLRNIHTISFLLIVTGVIVANQLNRH